MKQNRRSLLWIGLVVLVVIGGGLLALGLWRSRGAAPNLDFAQVKAVRAVRVDYLDMGQSRGQVAALEQQLKLAGVNLVAVGAGRADWAYFPWAEHSDSWSSEVQTSGIDFLGADSRRFGQWAHVTAVVDVLGPRYIATHPDAAAISWKGQPSKELVGTMELVEGEYGQRVLDLIGAVAANYPVNSISLAELVYEVDGYGARDEAAYLAYSGRADWPRTQAGDINIVDPSIGEWRSYEVNRFVEQAAALAHKHGKQLFLEVRASPADLASQGALSGTRYLLMLKSADRLVAWDNEGLEGDAPERLKNAARFFASYGADRVILLLGVWQQAGDTTLSDKALLTPVTAEALQAALEAAQQGGATSLWVAPSFLLSPAHWAVLDRAWGPSRPSAAQP